MFIRVFKFHAHLKRVLWENFQKAITILDKILLANNNLDLKKKRVILSSLTRIKVLDKLKNM